MNRGLIKRFVVTLVAVVLVGACGGEPLPIGVTEPIRIRGATFKAGPLPGRLPAGIEAPSFPPAVTSLETASTVIRLGQSGKTLLGRTSPQAIAVAVRLVDLGTGYWVLPVEGPDPQNGGEMNWQAVSDFGVDLPPGIHPLRVVALDDRGVSGTQRELSLCVTPPYADNLNACDPRIAPPAAILSLSWDVAADVDLVVVAPEGRVIDGKHPRTSLTSVDAGVSAFEGGAPNALASRETSVGTVDRDSNGGCVVDAIHRENLVFPAKPPKGSWLVYANLYDACNRGPVHFRFSLLEMQRAERSTFKLVETMTKRGILLPLEANGGSKLGTFVTEIEFP